MGSATSAGRGPPDAGQILGRLSAAVELPEPARSTRTSPASRSAATYVATNAEIKPSLGRNLAACPSQTAATCNSTPTAFDIVPPNTMYDERVQQIDVRFNRIFRLPNIGFGGSARVRANLDVYNL